jgi:predicted Zn finger-like uncharacterized protein
MDVRCERCRAQYVFDDEQVTPSGLTVQCTNCGHLFKVKKKELVVTVAVRPDEVEGTPLPATAAAPRASGAGDHLPAPPRDGDRREWRVRQASGNVFTFRELTTLQKWIVEGKVARDDEIAHGGETWKRLGDIGELASFFQVVEAAGRNRAAHAAPPPPAPAAAGGNVTAIFGAPVAPVPPPPSGFPPPSFTVPAPRAAPPPPVPAPPAPAPAAAALPRPPAPAARAPDPEPEPEPAAEDVPLEDDLRAVQRPRAGRIVAAVALVAAAAAAALFLGPLRRRPAPPPDPISVPLTIEVKPAAGPPAVPAGARASGAAADTGAAAPAAAAAPPAISAQPPPPTPAPDAAGPEAGPPALVAPVAAPEPVPERARTAPEPVTAPAKPPAPRTPRALLAQASRLRERGDAERALDLYGRVVAAEPENADALVGRGLCYLDLERSAPAEASFEAALRAAPGHADALMGLAETYRGRGQKAKALEYYEQYLALHPGGDEAAVARNAIEELRR